MATFEEYEAASALLLWSTSREFVAAVMASQPEEVRTLANEGVMSR